MQQLATLRRRREARESLLRAMDNLIAEQKGYNAQAVDAVNIANMMGKVFVGQVSALTRVGISFTEAQEKALKFGTEVEKAAMLAEVITDNVGNMNAELAKTDLGEIKNAENIIGDIKEEIGERLIPEIKFWKKLQLGILMAVTKTKEAIENISYKKATVEVKEYEKADKKTREKILSGWEKQADVFFDKWIEAKERGDEANRDFYATQFSLTKDMIADLKAVDDASEDVNDTLKEQIPILEKIKKEIADLKDLRDLSLTIEEYRKWNAELAELEKKLKYLNKIVAPARPEAPGKTTSITGEIIPVENIKEGTAALADMSGAIERNIEFSNYLREVFLNMVEVPSLVGEMFYVMADSIGAAFEKSEHIFQDFWNFFKNFLKQMVIKLVVATIAALALAAVLSMIGLADPTKAVKFMDVFKGKFAGMTGIELQKGALVYGNTLANVGEYPGVRTNPEVIAPLDKLQSIMGNRFGGKLQFTARISGRDLVFLLKETDRMDQNSF